MWVLRKAAEYVDVEKLRWSLKRKEKDMNCRQSISGADGMKLQVFCKQGGNNE